MGGWVTRWVFCFGVQLHDEVPFVEWGPLLLEAGHAERAERKGGESSTGFQKQNVIRIDALGLT